MSDATDSRGDPPGPMQRLEQWLRRRRRTRLAMSAAFGVVAVVLAVAFGNWIYAPAIGWDATALVFTGSVWFGIWPLSADTTARRAT